MNDEHSRMPEGQKESKNGISVTGAGGPTDKRTADGEDKKTLTTRQGHPVKYK